VIKRPFPVLTRMVLSLEKRGVKLIFLRTLEINLAEIMPESHEIPTLFRSKVIGQSEFEGSVKVKSESFGCFLNFLLRPEIISNASLGSFTKWI